MNSPEILNSSKSSFHMNLGNTTALGVLPTNPKRLRWWKEKSAMRNMPAGLQVYPKETGHFSLKANAREV